MTVHSLLSEGLTYIKADGSVVPAAAKSWEVSVKMDLLGHFI